MTERGVTIGSAATGHHVVGDDDTAIAVGSGDVPVLGTPRLIAWCEAATVAALAPELEPEQTSVGTRVAIAHLAPTPVGGSVTVEATVSEVDRRQVTFTVSANDEQAEICSGTITRVVVDRSRFMAKVAR
jgi:predicted thioesterase